jgi:putative transposase
MISINGMPDHVHMLIGIRPIQSISALLQDVKGSSSKWINEKEFSKRRFEWQEGYGAFSYSRSQLKDVITYIENQEQHHSKKSFREEYIDFLEKMKSIIMRNIFLTN